MAVEVAKGIHNHPHFKLGSILGSGQKDKRTVNFMDFLDISSVTVPKKWDFDAKRKPFASHLWGNDRFGDCELAGRANYVVRLQRGETHRDSPIIDSDVIDLYKQMTGCETPGDNNDTGLSTLDNLNQWRSSWLPTSQEADPKHDYQIAAFGFVEPKKHDLTAACIYLFSGVLYGINLPATAQQQTEAGGPWDYVPNSPDNEPGSWGGHCVYAKKFDENSVSCITWGQEIQMTESFIDAYAEEAYAVIESFDSWSKHKHVFDVSALEQEMQKVGITVQT